ncbi:putative lipoprotein [Pseudomonas aeruginosa]|nr:putative lipoprotein [Pseudomonas aeruginosa]
MFWCERRDCGSSSLLANAVFGNAKLYGPDEQQAYLLVRLAAPQENSLVAVYSITRGNRRAYLQAEELKADAPLGELLPSPATLLRLLKANGELTLSHVPAEPAAPGWSCWCGPCAWIPVCGSSCPASTPRSGATPCAGRAC